MSSAAFEPNPVQRASAAEQIAGQIREAIRSGRLSAGDRLPREHDLAEDFGVSRATVREAMRLLASAQLIQTARGAAGGTFVAHPAPDAVAESLSETIELWFQAGSTSAAEVDQARAWIERGCVRYAAENATEEDLEAIRAPIDAAEDVDDVDRFLELDLEFHVAISRAAHNSVLELAMTAVHLARPRTNTLLLSQLQLPPIVEQHRSIYEAIRGRDPDRAEAAFHEHVEHLRRVQAEALANRDAGSIAIGSISEAHPAPGDLPARLASPRRRR